LVVDTIGQFAGFSGDAENKAGDAIEAMKPLQEAAASRLGVVLVRHERKGGGHVGDAGRGSTAISGSVDFILRLRQPVGKARETLREIEALSRFEDTPSRVCVELTDEGYVLHGDGRPLAESEAQSAILQAFPDAEACPLTVAELAKLICHSRSTTQRAVE